MRLITLVIPTRNRPQNLALCLASLKRYEYLERPQIEVIVVDNNSDTQAVRTVCLQYPSVKYVFMSKLGRSAALNEGIREARGEYVAFTDDDVIIEDANWLQQLLSNFDGHPEVGYVSGKVVAFRTDTKAQQMWERKGGLSKGDNPLRFDAQFVARHHFSDVPIQLIAMGCNSIVSKEVLEEVGPYDELLGPGSPVPHGESLDFYYRILKHGYTAIYDPKAVIYHCHPRTMKLLRKKMFIYGIGDTAVHTKFFVKYRAVGSLFEALWHKPLRLLRRAAKSLVGKSSMSTDMWIASLAGALIGPAVYVRAYFLNKRDYRI